MATVNSVSEIPAGVTDYEISLSNLEPWMNAKEVKQALASVLTFSHFKGESDPCRVRIINTSSDKERSALLEYPSPTICN
jgi:hypothetical protein